MAELSRLAILAVTLAPLPLAAHHSFVAFDLEKEAFVRGTVAEYQFRNPHHHRFHAGRFGVPDRRGFAYLRVAALAAHHAATA